MKIKLLLDSAEVATSSWNVIEDEALKIISGSIAKYWIRIESMKQYESIEIWIHIQ